MEQKVFHTIETVVVLTGKEIQALVGNTIQQVDYFNASINQHYREIGEGDNKKKEFFIRIIYHGKELEITAGIGLEETTDKKTIPLASEWLYEGNPDFPELGERLGKQMREHVGETIVAFLEENKPSEATATE